MINPFDEVNWNPDRNGLRTFAKSITIGMPLVALMLGTFGRLRTHSWPAWTWWLAGIGFTVGVLLWLLPQIARPCYVVWNGLGCAVGFVTSNTAVIAIYFLVVTPIGLLLRLSGRDPLRLRGGRERNTYWEDAEKTGDATRYFRQY